MGGKVETVKGGKVETGKVRNSFGYILISGKKCVRARVSSKMVPNLS